MIRIWNKVMAVVMKERSNADSPAKEWSLRFRAFHMLGPLSQGHWTDPTGGFIKFEKIFVSFFFSLQMLCFRLPGCRDSRRKNQSGYWLDEGGHIEGEARVKGDFGDWVWLIRKNSGWQIQGDDGRSQLRSSAFKPRRCSTLISFTRERIFFFFFFASAHPILNCCLASVMILSYMGLGKGVWLLRD